MDWTLIFTATGAVATVISTIIAIRAKNESKKILEQIKEDHSRNIESKEKVNISIGNFIQNIVFWDCICYNASRQKVIAFQYGRRNDFPEP